nr:MAG: hypothetical protein [Leptosphaeria biglobosa narnavirus 4]
MSFLIPDGSQFDPDFGLDLFTCDGDSKLVDDLLPEIRRRADDVLHRYGFVPITDADLKKPVFEISAEVGDDEESVSSSKPFLALLPVIHEMAGMKVSWKDTSINSRFGNLAEDLVFLPDGYYQTYHNTRKTSSARDMAYLDVPKLRLAIDIRPMRMDHSGTNDGKTGLVGSRNSWIPFDSPIKGIYEIFSLYQDINLGLLRDKKFAYLPTQLGGYGKPIPFMEPSNFERFNKAYRQGTYSTLHREIVRRTIVLLHNDSLGFEVERDPLLAHIVRFESSFHDWIKNRSIYAPTTWLDIPEDLARFQAGRVTSNRQMNSALQRLASDGDLVTEKQLQVAIEHNELCAALLGSENMSSFKKKRDSKIAEWRKLSMYNLESLGLIKELSLEGYGLRELRPVEILRFHSLTRDKGKELKNILRDEAYYWPEALEHVYSKGPMKVSFMCFPQTRSGFTVAESRRYDVEDTEEDLLEKDKLIEWVRKGCIGPMPTKLVNDDETLIHQADGSKLICLITDDKALCREMNRRKGCPVVRVPVDWYYRSLYFGNADQPWVGFIRKQVPGYEIQCLEDTGAIKAFEELYFKDGVLAKRRIRQKMNIFKKIGEKDPIQMEESEDFSDEPPVRSIIPLLYDGKNVLKKRKDHKRSFVRR